MNSLTLLGHRKNGLPIYLARGGSDDLPPPDEDPTAAELAQLRQEKADREKEEAEKKDAELAELRDFKAKAAAVVETPKVKPPVKKADKPAAEAEPAKAVRKRGKSGASDRKSVV